MVFGEGKVCSKEGGGSCWGMRPISNSYLEIDVRLEREIGMPDVELSHLGNLDLTP